MYVRTAEGVGQAPMVSGFFAGTLGDDLQNMLVEFRERVHLRPQDYKKLLLLARLHPFPSMSEFISNYHVTTQHILLDLVVLAGVPIEPILDELYRISDRKLGREIEAEKQLWDKTVKTIQKLGPDKLKPFLLEPALLDPKSLQTNPLALSYDFRKVGLSFAYNAKKELGQKRIDSLIGSEASEAHLTNLGWRLARMAYALKNKDQAFKKDVDAFKKVVDQERRRRQKAEQEFKTKQQKKTAPVKKKKP